MWKDFIAQCRSKRWILVIAAVIILSGIFYAGNRMRYKSSIRRVLQEDNRIHAQCSTINDEPTRIITYYESLSKIKFNGCPSDFEEAYRRHKDAWATRALIYQEAAALLRQYKPGLGLFCKALIAGPIGGFRMLNYLTDEAVNLQKRDEQAIKQVNLTFKEILDIADSYGVNTSEYR